MEFLILGIVLVGGIFYITTIGWNSRDQTMHDKSELLSDIYRANNPFGHFELKKTDELFWQDDQTSAYYRESHIVAFHVNEEHLILRELSVIRDIKQAEKALLQSLKATKARCYYDGSAEESSNYKKGLKYRRSSGQ